MGLCASSSSNNNFPAPKSPGSKLPVVPGGGGKYGMNQNGNGNSKFIIGSGNFSTTKLIKRTENPAESLKMDYYLNPIYFIKFFTEETAVLNN